MCLYLRYYNIASLLLNLLLNLSCIVISIVCISLLLNLDSQEKKIFHMKTVNYVYLIIQITFGFVSTIVNLYFGMKYIYFKIISYSKMYLSTLFVNFLCTILLIIANYLLNYNYDETTFKTYEFYLDIVIIIASFLICNYIIGFYLGFIYISKLEQQIDDSPLNQLSNPDLLSDKIYENIIKQSKDPNNKELKEEYSILSRKSKALDNPINDSGAF